MINSKEEYYEFLKADKEMLKRRRKRPRFNDKIWRYEILLRKCEYYNNCKKGFFNRIIFGILREQRERLGIKCSFSIPLNVFDKGLSIAHIGPIIVNSGVKVGKNCRIHVCVNIGAAAGKKFDAPTIGDNVYIAPGVKMFGKIIIANNIAIGANAVVNKSFEEENITIAGVPAKKISNKGSRNLI